MGDRSGHPSRDSAKPCWDAFCYAFCMPQIVTRIDAQLESQIDELVAAGVVGSRSDAVRSGLRSLIDQHRRRTIGEAIVQGYLQHPQTEDDVGWADADTIAMIEAEPW